jgi:hypothetical protein
MPGLILTQDPVRIPGGEVELDDSLYIVALPGGGRARMGVRASGADPSGEDAELALHAAATTDVHGIADTSLLWPLDPVEKRWMPPAGYSILLQQDPMSADGGSINVYGIQAVHESVDHVTIYGDTFSGVGIYLLAPIEWAGGDDPFIQLPAAYPMVPNLDAEFVGGHDSAYLLSRANHTGSQPAASISDFAAAVASTPPASHTHAAADIASGLLALTRGGTGADGSALAAGRFLASPAAASGAAVYRAMAESDVPSLNASKIGAGNLAAARLPTGSTAWNLGAGTTLNLQGFFIVGESSIALGNSLATSVGFRFTPSGMSGATSQTGMFADPIFPSGATVAGRVHLARLRTAAAAFTMAEGSAYYVQNASLGAGSTVNTQYGLFVEALSGAGSNIAIQTGANPSRFGGEVEIDGSFNHDGSTFGAFNVTPVVRPAPYTQTYSTATRTLGAYSPNAQSAAYTGAADGEAKLADLNALRAAYENLRTFVENLAGVLNSHTNDLRSLGFVQ